GARLVGERRLHRGRPDRVTATAAPRRRFERERFDQHLAKRHAEVKVRELGHSAQADAPDRLRRLYGVARLHQDATPRHVTVLRLPAVAVIDDDAVAALAAFDRLDSTFADRDIGHFIAPSEHAARCGREHLHPGALLAHRRNADVEALVTVVGAAAALIIACLRGGIEIQVVLYLARDADLALDRQLQLDGRGDVR